MRPGFTSIRGPPYGKSLLRFISGADSVHEARSSCSLQGSYIIDIEREGFAGEKRENRKRKCILSMYSNNTYNPFLYVA